MTSEYNLKVVNFGDHVEVIKYGHLKQRVAGNNRLANHERKIRTEEEQDKYNFQQAKKIQRRIRYYCECNDFDLFWTLTFDDEKVNARDYEYAKKKLRAWLKYQREKYGKFDYIFIPELHKSGRIHFHGITFGFSPLLIEARNPKTDKLIKKNGLQIYNAETWKDGFSTVSKIDSKAKTANYISKYITKDLIAIPSAYKQPKYFVSRGLKKPEIEFKQTDGDELQMFIPNFIVGSLYIEDQKFEKDVLLYQLELDDENNFFQKNKPETVVRSRLKSKNEEG
ncbi:hypothetical protein RF505_07560 [Streptococcus mutans]|uniref:rolling circle replication-associated protein n=1 Tax=Streptococcus mutans TaxID=1309 RepID=UPI00298F0EB6|nr:hypothetical protein [Streptococcus mutans]MDW8509793.1 hypothetical protein [Streptococcus mutans]